MDIYVFSPNAKSLLDDGLLKKLNNSGKVIITTKIKPLSEIDGLYSSKEPKILAVDPDYFEWKLPNEIIDKVPNVKCICLQTTGFNWVDSDHAKKKDIPVTNLRGFSSISVAEWATLITLALARRLPLVIKDSWKPDVNMHKGIELRGKTAGVIGLGRIGTAIAENMQGLGMQVQYWSKNTRDDRFQYVDLKKLVSTSDVLLSAIAFNDETANLIPDNLLKTMKKSAILVNITHPIFNHQLALDMIKAGSLYGYGYENEKLGEFGGTDGNVWNGPALGWCTEESMRNNAEQWVDSIVKASKGEYPTQINV